MMSVSILFNLYPSLLCYGYTNTQYFPTIFVACFTPGTSSSGIIVHKYFSQKSKRGQINGGGKGF